MAECAGVAKCGTKTSPFSPSTDGGISVAYSPGNQGKKGLSLPVTHYPRYYLDVVLPDFIGDVSAYLKILDLAMKVGVSGQKNLARIVRILNLCSARVDDENHNFVFLVLTVMVIESHLNEAAKSNAGAIGIMQVKPISAVDILLKLDPSKDKIIFELLGLRQDSPLFVKLQRIWSLDLKCRTAGTNDQAKAARREYRLAVKSALQAAKNELSDPTFNTTIGIVLLARLIESYKSDGGAEISEATAVKAISAYNAGSGCVGRAQNMSGTAFVEYLPKETRNCVNRAANVFAQIRAISRQNCYSGAYDLSQIRFK